MKKFLALALLLCLTVTLCGCHSAIIYDEEKTVNAWLEERTEGYQTVSPSRRMILTNVEEGFKIRIDTGSDAQPRLTVENDAINTIAVENGILTVTAGDKVYAAADNSNKVFDPYRNAYTSSMKVYQKDENTFRVFFWLYGEDTDFYPLPKLLTEEQYSQMLTVVENYTQTQAQQSELQGEDPFNYSGEFMSLYKGKYFSDLAKNPEGTIYYEATGTTTENAAIYRNLFTSLGLSEQGWRESYENLGYTGQNLNLQIVYFDMVMGTDKVTLTLHTNDAYSSPKLKEANLSLTYGFCPSLQNFDFIGTEVK